MIRPYELSQAMKRELTAHEQRTMAAALSKSVTVIDGPTGGCSCLYVEPCKPTCSCAYPLQSGGCDRCCSYGSLEQRQAGAERLAQQALDAATMLAIADHNDEFVTGWLAGRD